MIILRADVDMPFSTKVDYTLEYYCFHKCPRYINPSPIRRLMYHFFGYYKNLVRFTELLKDYGVEATIFLSDKFVPPKTLKKHLARHDVGLHISTDSPERIFCYKKLLERLFGRVINKFSVHDISLFIKEKWFIEEILKGNYGFKLFSGNHPPVTLKYHTFGGRYYFPEIFYTRCSPVIGTHDFNKYTMNWLFKNERGKVIVVCTHPVELENRLDGTEETRRKLEEIFRKCYVTSFEGWLREST